MKQNTNKLFYIVISALVLFAGCLICDSTQVLAAESGESRVRNLVNNEGYELKNVMLNQSINKVFTVKLSQDVDINTFKAGVELIEKESGNAVTLTCEYSGSREVKLTPGTLLSSGKCYYLILHNTIKNISGTLTLIKGVVQEVSVGNQYNSLCVNNINLTGNNEVVIKFNTALDSSTATSILNYAVYNSTSQSPVQIASVILDSDASTVKLQLTKALSTDTDQVHVSVYNNIKSIYGTSLGSNYQTDIFLINRQAGDWSSDSINYPRAINGSLDILAPNRTLVNADVSGDVYIANNKVTLQNLKVAGTIFVDPGVSGSASLDNVQATRIEVLSGSTDGILLKDVKTDELFINSRSEVKLKVEGQTDIFKSVVQFQEYDVTLQTETSGNATFGRVQVSSASVSGKTLKLQGYFDKPLQVYQALTISNVSGFIRRIDLAVESERAAATVKLEGVCSESSTGQLYSGYFGKVQVQTPVALAIEKAQLGVLDIQTLGVDLTADRLAFVRTVNTYGKDALLEMEEGAWIGAPTLCTVVIKPGSIDGTMSIKQLSHPNATSFTYKVQTGDFTIWPSKMDDPKELSLSSSFAPYLERVGSEDFPLAFANVNAPKTNFTKAGMTSYTGSEDIPVLIGQDFGVLAFNKENKVVAFVDHILKTTEVRGGESVAPVLTAQILPGSANKTTRVVARASSGNKLAIQVSSQLLATPKVRDTLATSTKITNPYTSGADISGVDASVNKYLAIYELDSKNRVVKYKLFIVTAKNIKGTSGGQTLGTYEIIVVIDGLKSNFQVTVEGLANANYFNVFRNGEPLNENPVAIDQPIPSMPQMYSDPSILVVRFYSDAEGSNEVGSAVCQDGSLVTQIVGTGEYKIEVVIEGLKSNFTVTVEDLEDALYFNVFRDGEPLNENPVAIDQPIPSMPQMFSDTSKLLVRFYSDAEGTKLIATGRLDNGSLIISK